MSSKPRITIFHCGFIYTGGGERIVIEEVLDLRRRGYPVECFAPTLDKKACYPDVIDGVNIKTLLPQLPSWAPFRFAFLMLASCLLAPFFVFRFLKTDLFIGANQPGAYLAWVMAKILNRPYFVYLNQPNRILYPRNGENWQSVNDYYVLNAFLNRFRGLLVWLDKSSLVQAKKIFINGSFVAQEIERTYELESWVDCPAGVDCDDKKISARQNCWQGRVKINGKSVKKPYILLTSRHVPWKRFDWAVRVLKKIIKDVPEAQLIIPGEWTKYTLILKKIVDELELEDKVLFPGVITQKSLWRLYGNAAIYCFPSPEEDLGIVVLEAQAHGVPVVAWNYGGPTVTVKSGETGFLVKPYDLEIMAKRMVELLVNPGLRKKMGRVARKYVWENFSWERHVDILEKEIKSLPLS